MAHMGVIFIDDEQSPCFVPKIRDVGLVEIIFALLIKDGPRKGNLTLMTNLVEEEESGSRDYPAVVNALLDEFIDVMLFELPRELPPSLCCGSSDLVGA